MQLVQRDLLLSAGQAGAADAVHVLPILRAQDRGEEGGRMIQYCRYCIHMIVGDVRRAVW